MYFKDRYKSTDIHIYEQANETIRLLQADKKYPLSKFYSNEGKVKTIINCSYFTNDYVLGRNQGDLKNDTHDQEGFYDLVFLKDGTYKLGNFKSWDYTDVLAGFSVATVLIKDGVNSERCSSAICNNTKISSRNPQTCVAVLKGNKVIFIVSEGRNSNDVGLTGYDVRNYVRDNYPDVELLVQLDGGGSSEMIVDGVIKNYLSDGKERSMFNGLALLKKEEEPKEEPKGDDNMATKVLDVSSYQSNIDYAKVKASGIGGVILCCGRTYWGEIRVAGDDTFEKHYQGFKAVGMPVGVYYYSAANTVTKAKEEADFVLNVLKGKQLELPVYFDVENNERQKPLSKQALTDVTKAFCEVIEKAGYYVGIYASSSWLKDELDMNQLNNYDVWVAHYGVSKPSYNGNYGMWQYTSSGTVDGINGNVDLSYCYKDYPTIIKNAKLNGYKEEEVAESETDKLKEEIADLKAKLTSSNSQLVEANKIVSDKETEIVKLEKKLKEINDISKDYA